MHMMDACKIAMPSGLAFPEKIAFYAARAYVCARENSLELGQ